MSDNYCVKVNNDGKKWESLFNSKRSTFISGLTQQDV